jgi:cytochrome b pre-mRNA-processing protein 3
MRFWPKILKKRARVSPERAVYEAIVATARRPFLYEDFGVPDTVMGRFDMIALHAFLVLERVKDAEPVFAQALTDEIFRDMDRSLREMGVGDLSVGKKIRDLAEIFYGRIQAYQRDIDDPERLANALTRNVWSAVTNKGQSPQLVAYSMILRQQLAAQSPSEIAAGSIKLTCKHRSS